MRSSPVPEHREHSSTVPNHIPTSHATWSWSMGMKPQWHVTNLYPVVHGQGHPILCARKSHSLSFVIIPNPVKSYNNCLIINHSCVQLLIIVYVYSHCNTKIPA